MNSPDEKVHAPNDDIEIVPGEDALVKLVDRMVRESGDPRGFDAAKWFGGGSMSMFLRWATRRRA